MFRIVLTLALSLAAPQVLAQARPSTVDRPCLASRQLVLQQGAIVLGTGGFTYDRFVRDRSFCEVAEYIEPAWVPSLDIPQCFVGYRCKAGPKQLWSN
jgi:hypothetical protein